MQSGKKTIEEIIKLSRRSSTFGVILGIRGQVVISGKQQQLHSYNSSKCINDHRRDDQGKVLGGDEPPTCRSASSHNAKDCRAKGQNKEKKTRRGKEKKGKKFKSFFLSYKAHCAVRVGGAKLDCFNQSAPTRPLSPARGKKKLSFHEYSTSKIETTQVSA